MNNTEPSASDVAAFENDLEQHRVKLLIYNSQASDPIAERMREARQTNRMSRSSARPKPSRRAKLPGLDDERARRGRSSLAEMTRKG